MGLRSVTRQAAIEAPVSAGTGARSRNWPMTRIPRIGDRWLIDEVIAIESGNIGSPAGDPLAPDGIGVVVKIDPEVFLIEPRPVLRAVTERVPLELRQERGSCRVDSAFVIGYGESIGQGFALADAIKELLADELPELFAETTFATAAQVDRPPGRIELDLFVTPSWSTASGTPVASGAPST